VAAGVLARQPGTQALSEHTPLQQSLLARQPPPFAAQAQAPAAQLPLQQSAGRLQAAPFAWHAQLPASHPPLQHSLPVTQ
jgi:hypothetical protein